MSDIANSGPPARTTLGEIIDEALDRRASKIDVVSDADGDVASVAVTYRRPSGIVITEHATRSEHE